MTSLTWPLASDWALTAQIISSRQPLPASVLLTPMTKSPPAAAVPAGSLPAGSGAGRFRVRTVRWCPCEAPAPMPVAKVRASADAARRRRAVTSVFSCGSPPWFVPGVSWLAPVAQEIGDGRRVPARRPLLPPTLDHFCRLSSRRCPGAMESRCGSIRRWRAIAPAVPVPCCSCSATARRGRAASSPPRPDSVDRRSPSVSTRSSPARLVGAAGEATSTGGRPPTRFAFNPRARVVLGADVGATHVRLAVTDLAATVLADDVVDLDIARRPGEGAARGSSTAARLLVRRAGRRIGDVVGVGIGLPGPVEFATGRPTSPPIMPGWDGFDVPGFVRRVAARRRRRRRQRRQRDGPRRALPGLPRRRPPDVRQGRDRHRLRHHQRRGAAPRRQRRGRRPRPRPGARRRRRRCAAAATSAASRRSPSGAAVAARAAASSASRPASSRDVVALARGRIDGGDRADPRRRADDRRGAGQRRQPAQPEHHRHRWIARRGRRPAAGRRARGRVPTLAAAGDGRPAHRRPRRRGCAPASSGRRCWRSSTPSPPTRSTRCSADHCRSRRTDGEDGGGAPGVLAVGGVEQLGRSLGADHRRTREHGRHHAALDEALGRLHLDLVDDRRSRRSTSPGRPGCRRPSIVTRASAAGVHRSMTTSAWS